MTAPLLLLDDALSRLRTGAATISCNGATAATFTDGGSTPTITKTLGDGSTTLTPGTYNCQIVTDP